jgi:SAM-dependent methyltransferase
MLQSFKDEGVQVLGIDPAKGPAAAAQAKGIPTVEAFFNRDLARKLTDKGIHGDVILANNLLMLMPCVRDLVEGIALLLKPNGVAVLENISQVKLVTHCEFDMVYHANLCYFSLTALDRLFRLCGLYINHIEETPVFGGSLRIYVERIDAPSRQVGDMLNAEAALGVADYDFYANFGQRVERTKKKILDLLKSLKAQGKTLAVYGAAGGMATTMMNYLELDKSMIDLAVDNNPQKHGLFMPVNRIEIEHPRRLLEVRPDYTLMLAWNYRDEVLKAQQAYRDLGGKFIVPLPELEVV